MVVSWWNWTVYNLFSIFPFIVDDRLMMGKRRRSVALIESDSDDDSNSGADIDAVITNPVFRCLVGNRNRNLSVNVIKCYLKAGSN